SASRPLGSTADHQRGLLRAAILFLLALVVGFAIRYSQEVLLNYLGQRVMYDLRMQIFTRLQRLPLAFFDRNPVGRLMTRLTNDVDALNEMLTDGAVAIFGDIFTLLGIVGVLLWLNWRLALVTFVILPVLVVFMSLFRRAMRDSYRQVRTRLARLNAYIAENISGTQIVQLFNREQRNFTAFDALNLDYLGANLRSLFYFALFYPTVSVLSSVAIALIVWYGGGNVLAPAAGGSRGVLPALTLGSLVAFLSYADRFFVPIRDLSEKYNILQGAMAASERIFGILDERETIVDPPDPVPLGEVRGEVEFQSVWFSYNPDEWVLKDVSFTIAAGESVAIVGATGAGKTSLIALLSRFYDVQRGAILVDGHDVREVAQAELRRHIGVVLQDPFIFSGTIAGNIRLHEERISDERVRAAARFVNADGFISELPQGYDTPVRERGAGLSVGQKQLLAFARAIAFNPEILLVLDEATSSVDTETEALIQDALARLMQGRTSIIIAHRLSTIRNVDRIIVLHKGRVVEQGTHEELLARAGIYRNLYELQYQSAGLGTAS
ncbi:MAG TPA: ABC transporter ATP-binding protein, partial [Chloroflexota bacterium]|nr:ABC transporter ATP-binding protein [Chloroflexota bacterium]